MNKKSISSMFGVSHLRNKEFGRPETVEERKYKDDMSRKRKELRDHKKGVKTTVRAVVVSTYKQGDRLPTINVDCGGWSAGFVADMLINAGKLLKEKSTEVANNEITQGIREDNTVAEVEGGPVADTRWIDTSRTEAVIGH